MGSRRSRKSSTRSRRTSNATISTAALPWPWRLVPGKLSLRQGRPRSKRLSHYSMIPRPMLPSEILVRGMVRWPMLPLRVAAPPPVSQRQLNSPEDQLQSALSKAGETETSGEAHKEASQNSDDTMISEAWKLCAEQAWKREDLLVQKWKNEISYLLTFAGLFSAASPPTLASLASEQDAATITSPRQISVELLVGYLEEIAGGKFKAVPLFRYLMSMIEAAPKAAPPDVARTTTDISVLRSVIRPYLLQAPSVITILPVFYEVLECRAQGVDRSANPPTLTWSTNEQDAAATTALTEICIDFLDKYLCEIGSGQFEQVALLDHLASSLHSMPPDAARTISCQIMETLRTCGPHDATWEQRHYLCAIWSASFIDEVVRPSIQSGGLPLEIALQVYHNIVRYRIRGVDYSQTWSRDTITGADADAVTAMGYLSLEMFTRIMSEVTDTTELHRHQMQTLAVIHNLLVDVPHGRLAALHGLVRLLPAPELHPQVLDMLVFTIWKLDGGFRLDIEDTRKLLTFLPHARERLNTEQFIKITRLALQHSARLPPDDFGCVYSDVCGALDIVVECFSSSQMEVAQADAWLAFSNLLDVCIELARMDIARPAGDDRHLTRDIVNALERCASQCPERHSLRFWIRHTMQEICSICGYSAGSVAETPQEVSMKHLWSIRGRLRRLVWYR
ncbi:hypothetical protein IEO21_08531 [Rhodonia placenta]|uniref:Ig-like domain-containing protein n=1 Tax=Rhodonia placenta TaxID=104341 RepID=A0A8H7NVZ3_9APHY|nr:hypothetical protein IEO21_08531 [Postia placenta]